MTLRIVQGQLRNRAPAALLTAAVLLPAMAGLNPAAFAEEPASGAKAELPPIEFSGYWRMGYQTDLNPLQANQSEQGTTAPTSRHTRSPNYFDLQLGKTFSNGARVKFTVDSDANLGFSPHQNDSWDVSKDPEAINNRLLRVRDLYLEVPVGEAKIWAGARRLEWEDIRVLDYLNPFNVNGYGIGGTVASTDLVLSYVDRKDDTAAKTPLKDVTFLARHTMSISENRAIKPMLMIKQFGSAPKNDSTGQTEVKGATGFKLGGIYSSWSDSHSANMGVWFESNPIDSTGTKSGSDTGIGLMASNAYEFGDYGVLTGLHLFYDSYKDSKPVYKIADDKKSLVLDGDKTANNSITYSAAVQPVYYATKNVHLALDLNYAGKTKKVSDADANAILVTPILRYAMEKNVMGTPQIYTSVTYGSYDWKAKKNAEAEATDALVTTQTGFEVWF
jgi:maltoporin